MQRLFSFMLAFSLCPFCLSAPAAAGAGSNLPILDLAQGLDPGGAGTVVRLSDGGVRVWVDSFGRAGATDDCLPAIGEGFMARTEYSVLCRHLDFFSAGGRVLAIRNSNCDISVPVTALADNYAYSIVQCGEPKQGNCLFIFEQFVDGPTETWYTNVYSTGCALDCYFSYTDYNVYTYFDNNASWQPGAGGYRGQFVVRNIDFKPDNMKFLFTDLSGAMGWSQQEYPMLLDFIDNPLEPLCRDLPPAATAFNGDWTGALHYRFTDVDPTAYTVISYSHGRDRTPVP